MPHDYPCNPQHPDAKQDANTTKMYHIIQAKRIVRHVLWRRIFQWVDPGTQWHMLTHRIAETPMHILVMAY